MEHNPGYPFCCLKHGLGAILFFGGTILLIHHFLTRNSIAVNEAVGA